MMRKLVALAAVCFFTKFYRLSTMLVAWMSTNLLVSRLGLRWMGWKKPCGCLGNITRVGGTTKATKATKWSKKNR